MLINLRNALMTRKRLPYDAEVEYLQSSGTQWIDTGIVPKTTSKMVADIQFAIVSENMVSGAWGSNGRFQFGVVSEIFSVGIGSIGQNASSADTDRHVFMLDANTKTASIDSTQYSLSSARISFANVTIPIFAQKYASNAPVAYCKAKLYSYKLYDDATLVRDYIPVRKGTVGYLYDRVSGKLFGNAGTGDFVLGPDVVPVEYIESHGTEYIDTGVVPTAADSFYCRVQQSVARDQCLWGLAGVTYCFSNYNAGSSTTGNGTYWGHPAIGYGGVNGVNPLGDTNWHEILCQSSGIFVDGTQINTQVTAPTQSPLNTIALFARAVNSAGGGVAKNGQGRMSAFRIERNAAPLRSFRPVRVGSGSTWEGAMMDVLTRRIYRNAGTGAFSYGDDLKYPIPAE